MRPADDMKRLFAEARLGIRPDPDERVLADVLRARQEHRENATAAPSQWRITMKSSEETRLTWEKPVLRDLEITETQGGTNSSYYEATTSNGQLYV